MHRNSTFPKDNAVDFRAIEFFAGVGGFSAAWPGINTAVAIDINQGAAEVYAANHPHPFWVREIQSISRRELEDLQANLWWMSPPCQPYTYRGVRRDIADPRAQSLLHLIALMGECRPEFLVLENVVGFGESIAFERLTNQLARCSYQWKTIELCPTQMGWPNRRPRFYLLASHRELFDWQPLPQYSLRTTDLLDLHNPQVNTSELLMERATVAAIEEAIDRCDPRADRPTACFASSYGRAMLNSGSYLQLKDGRYRRFAPREVANLLGFPGSFYLPSCQSTRALWKLLGNSLSLPAVRYILSHLPGGPSPRLPWRSPD